METRVLALDFGASGARAMRAVTDGETLSVTQLHRWENVPITVDGRLSWDIDALMAEVKKSLRLAAEAGGVDAIGVDTWGVDFGLIGEDGALLEPPVHYRDTRTQGMLQKAERYITRERLYALTGNQLMEINTAFQLLSLKEQRTEVLARTETMLLMPDLFAYLLTGCIGAEYSIASTTQLLSCDTRDWSDEVVAALGLPRHILPPVTSAGMVRGTLLPEIGKEIGLPPVPVIAVAGHDTASAAFAAPMHSPDAMFVSCGTWALAGTMLDKPMATADACHARMANEGGYGGKITFLRNLTGLWLVQESRRQWQREGKMLSFAELETQAAVSACAARFDTQAERLTRPGDVPGAIRALCAQAGGCVPETPGDVVRAIYESLADAFAETKRDIEHCTGRHIPEIDLIGGGARGALLPQITANRTGCTVYVGPVEATVLGNLSAQLIALGAVADEHAARCLIASQETINEYKPEGKV